MDKYVKKLEEQNKKLQDKVKELEEKLDKYESQSEIVNVSTMGISGNPSSGITWTANNNNWFDKGKGLTTFNGNMNHITTVIDHIEEKIENEVKQSLKEKENRIPMLLKYYFYEALVCLYYIRVC